MKVTYIHHSSFLVETDENYFLFDYFEGELPEFKEDKPLLVFASHRHGDHFSPVIFELAGKHKKTGFVLSDDIWKRRVPEEFLGKTYFTGPGEELELTAPFTGGSGVKIRAFKSLKILRFCCLTFTEDIISKLLLFQIFLFSLFLPIFFFLSTSLSHLPSPSL